MTTSCCTGASGCRSTPTAWCSPPRTPPDTQLSARTYYSVGGGFVLADGEDGEPRIVPDPTPVPHPFRTGAELLAHTRATGLPISGVMLANERAWRSEDQIRRAC